MNLELRRLPQKRLYATILVVAVLAVLLILPVSVGRTVSVSAKVLPAKEWLLVKSQAGSLLAVLCDHLYGTVDSYTVVSVVRGDAFGFTMHASRRPGDVISAGDTIVSIRSHELLRESQRLAGELAVARANLSVMVTGEKEPVAMEAERSVNLAKENAGLQAILLQRQDSLYRRNLISREEYDLARSAAQQAAIEVAIAEARLQTVRTGSKPELIRMVHSQIAALEQELEALQTQLTSLTLVSPFSGILSSSSGIDTLCTVQDTGRVVLIALPVEYLHRVAPGQPVSFRVPRIAGSFRGRLVTVIPQVRNLMGRQCVTATATLEAADRRLPAHLIMVGVIETERVPLGRYIVYWLTDAWEEVIGAATGG